MNDIDHEQIVRLFGGVPQLARRLRIRGPSVYNWRDASGAMRIPDARLLELAAEIERRSCGMYTRKMIRPDDWHLIWPELPGAAERTAATQPQQEAA